MSKEKEAAFLDLKTRSESAGSFDDIASIFQSLVRLMRDYKSSAPTAACFAALDALGSRLENHHEIPRASESSDSFSALLTKSVAKPVESLLAQVQSQHKAIQSLSKTVESLKNSRLATPSSFAAAAASPPGTPKSKPAPLPTPPDERLIRCDGEIPPILLLPYHSLIPAVNKVLDQLGLPKFVYASRLGKDGLFLAAESKEAIGLLEKAWADWGPTAFPGSRIAPPADHSHIQVDGILFSSVQSMEDLKRQVQDQNPSIGRIEGTPT
ncbi:hypothetical protein C8R44DRAFT_887698 [Mycena epipterygia]|nr:hypothetical protein C8R44DRAFT_887698 [Mycena epipterygia]